MATRRALPARTYMHQAPSDLEVIPQPGAKPVYHKRVDPRTRAKQKVQERVDAAVAKIALCEKFGLTATYDMSAAEKADVVAALLEAVDRVRYALDHPNKGGSRRIRWDDEVEQEDDLASRSA